MVVHVLHNPAAVERSRQAAQRVAASFRSDGHRVVELGGRTPEATTDQLRHAIEQGHVEHLVIAGGDGLVHLAIQHVALTSIAVSIAPIGTGNDFATAVSEHFEAGDLPELHADLIRVTTADGTNRWAASVAIAGFPADINARANTMSRSWGSNVYAVAVAKELPKFTRRTFELSIDDIPIKTDSAMLAIGNTKYFGGGMLPCPDAEPDDGLLHLTSIQNVGRIGLAPHLLGRAGGTADRKEVLRGEGHQIDIHSVGQDFWADGEPLGHSPLSFEIVPRALLITKVLQPD